MRYIFLYVIIFIVSFNYSFAQSVDDGICNETYFFGNSIDKLEYVSYANRIIKDRFSSFDEVKNLTPEELIKSQMSVRDNKWLSFNYGKDISWDKKQFERVINPKNYLKILCKINIATNNGSFSLVKMNLLNDNKKPQSLSLVMKNIGNRWVLLNDKTLSNLNFIMMFLSVDDLDNIFFKNINSDNQKMNKIIDDSWVDESLDLNMIIKRTGELLIKSEYKVKPYVNIHTKNKGSEKIINTLFTVPLKDQKFCFYFPNKMDSIIDNEFDLVIEYIESSNERSFENELETKITPIHNFSYQKNNRRIFLMKYLDNNGTIKTDSLYIEDGEVLKIPLLDEMEMKLYYIIKTLKSEAMIQFSNEEDSPNYPEINQLKPLVKDAHGVLNIEKLAQIIKENQASLGKYLEE